MTLAYPIRQGVASAIAPHAETVDALASAPRHALLCDFDRDALPRIAARCAAAIRMWRLPPVVIRASGSRGGCHALSLCGRPACEILAIARFVGSDARHREALTMHGFNVLRVGPKVLDDGGIETPAPRHVLTLPSPHPDECRAEWLHVLDYSLPLAVTP